MADTKQVLDMIEEHDVKYVDFRFTDPRGKWQHLAHHVRTITDDFLNDGVPFDGSSLTGYRPRSSSRRSDGCTRDQGIVGTAAHAGRSGRSS